MNKRPYSCKFRQRHVRKTKIYGSRQFCRIGVLSSEVCFLRERIKSLEESLRLSMLTQNRLAARCRSMIDFDVQRLDLLKHR